MEHFIRIHQSDYPNKAPQIIIKILLAIGLLVFGLPTRSQSGRFDESEVKAAYVLNFIRFIEWPQEAFSIERSPFVIGLLGESRMGSVLENIVSGETLRGREIVVRHPGSHDEIAGCHMLFIAGSGGRSLDRALLAMEGQSILTVSDLEGFAKQGGMIGFFVEGNNLRFEINAEAVRKSDLNVSSKLFRLSRPSTSPE